jgi:hypothetical protein
MKFLQYSPLKFLDMLYIKQTERTAGGGKDRDAVRKQVIDGLSEENAPPLLVFPEGGLTTGASSLLQFHKFLFSLNEHIQPIALVPKGGPLPINLDNNMGTTWCNILSYAFQPWQRFHVIYLPPCKQRTNEDSLDFARRVMNNIATKKGITSSPFLYRDKRIYSKMKAALHQEGFRYRFVNQNNNRAKKNGKTNRVSPEEIVTNEVGAEVEVEELPSIVLRSKCGMCCNTQSFNVIDNKIDLIGTADANNNTVLSPLDYLELRIQAAFKNEDGTSKSQVFEIGEGGTVTSCIDDQV